MVLERGLVFMSDTRTNAGLDNISTFRKMTIWENPGECVITLMSAGNLATTQAVVSLLEERAKSPDERTPALLGVPSMFQAVRMVAETLREVIGQHSSGGLQSESAFKATLLVGGQVKGSAPRLFMVYPEGNFIEASADTPFFQIGETKYGRPILVRAFDAGMSFEEVMKLLLVSFDSTVKANLSVGAPFDYHFYAADSFSTGRTGRIALDDPYFQSVSQDWGDKLKAALDSLPDYSFDM
ncbi:MULTISPECIES: peptidase [Roseinatronobacter]|uniref:Peptidase n=1 Tax=Roseinatronobacter domitianus TaxID=2940293 RepID=A0ABT0M062_9RHOB|nr:MULTISPECIES: peptidase [Roseibaca]MCL1628262.1 peptidase [Roseibaca domitiana]